jgi:hypothetical protein
MKKIIDDEDKVEELSNKILFNDQTTMDTL